MRLARHARHHCPRLRFLPQWAMAEEQERCWMLSRNSSQPSPCSSWREHLKQEGLRGVQKKVVAGKHPQRKGASRLIAPGFKVACASLCYPANRQRLRWDSSGEARPNTRRFRRARNPPAKEEVRSPLVLRAPTPLSGYRSGGALPLKILLQAAYEWASLDEEFEAHDRRKQTGERDLRHTVCGAGARVQTPPTLPGCGRRSQRACPEARRGLGQGPR